MAFTLHSKRFTPGKNTKHLSTGKVVRGKLSEHKNNHRYTDKGIKKENVTTVPRGNCTIRKLWETWKSCLQQVIQIKTLIQIQKKNMINA